jgi:arylformamidase
LSFPAFALDAKIKVLRDIAYGPDAAQRIDVYLPQQQPTNAPIIAMVHGGAWLFGDKSNSQVVENKANRWVGKGIVFVAINNRLVPAATPVQQTEDVARALAMIQREAKSWGADPMKVVLIGHSAGAHLVALLSADPTRQMNGRRALAGNGCAR